MKYVIIGNSAAAIGCIEGIRKVDSDGQITVISKEKYHTYSRPLISYLLEGKTDLERMKYRSDSFYDDNKCTFMPGKTVVSVNSDEKTVTLSENSVIPYDKLLISTGSAPFIPPTKGYGNVKNKFTFMSLDDALSLGNSLKKNSRVLIVGAGLIGLKCCEGIYGKCGSITVVDLADRVMPSVLDEKSSDIVKKHIEKQGITFMLSDCVNEYKENKAVLKSGKTIDFDILVTAVGVKPETGLAAACGIKTNRGILTDSTGKTSDESVYAAGDCTESYDISCDKRKILALLPNAYMQGEASGISMAGGEGSFDKALPMNSIGFFGLHIVTAGTPDGEEYVVSDSENYKKLVTKDNFLKGYILVGDVARAGIYTSMIREKMKLNEMNFEAVRENPSMIAFGEEYRHQYLSGIK